MHFRVWAPKRRTVAVVLADGGGPFGLQREDDGYFSGRVSTAGAGALYRLRLDDGDSIPDPASRFQPSGPHGPSMVVDPSAFRWTDADWHGIEPERRVLYELHVGTFTREGTWPAAMAELGALAELGVTLVEVMPVADFAGRFGWGYDGVNLFAPTHLYGEPDDFRRFVDRAHALGLGVVLDVVYNHLGPDGNYLRAFADHYFSTRYTTDWGEALSFDEPSSGPVRELCLSNVQHWIDEYHLDGLRIDATQNVYDASARHILCDIGERARAAAPQRRLFIVAENEPQQTSLLRRPDEGGMGLDALWNDDWHHSAMVNLTGRDEAYYRDYRGSARELVAAARHGFLYQGQWYSWQKKRRGSSTHGIAPSRFVHFLQNHDQVANSFRGERIHALSSPARLRAMTALLLLGPQVPMLFQGQEFAASSPFLYFADHRPELMALIQRGRSEFIAQFDSLASAAMRRLLHDPADPESFLRCKLDHGERARHAHVVALHRDLLRLRHTDPALAQAGRTGVDGAVLADDALVLRFSRGSPDDRMLLVNLGRPLHLDLVPEPLLAPPESAVWTVRWSSENPTYGGNGIPCLAPTLQDWRIPGGCAVLFAPSTDLTRDDERSHG